MSALPCLTLMSSLKTIILKYILVCVFLVSPCCVHRDRRPDPNSKRRLRRRSREFSPRLSHPAVRGSSRRRSRLSDPGVRGSWRHRSRLSHPSVRGSSRRHSRINQPTVRRRWRRRPRLTLAHRPASDSMPAGLPLTQCPPTCLWLKLAGLPLTHARWPPFAGKTNSPRPVVSRRRPRLTDPAVRGRSRRRPWGKPTHRRRLPLVRGEGQPAVRGHSARRRLWLPPARRPPPLSGQASRLWSRQPAVAVFVTKVFLNCFRVCFAPEGSWYPWAAPWIFLGGVQRSRL